MAKKILVVDDEHHIVRLVEVNLVRAGYDVVTAYDGVKALEKVELEKPDMVITNIDMPRMDGFEVLQNMQASPTTADIPVIILSRRAEDADIFKGWQAGVSSYLTKPFNPRVLLTSVDEIFASIDGEGEDDEPWEY